MLLGNFVFLIFHCVILTFLSLVFLLLPDRNYERRHVFVADHGGGDGGEGGGGYGDAFFVSRATRGQMRPLS